MNAESTDRVVTALNITDETYIGTKELPNMDFFNHLGKVLSIEKHRKAWKVIKKVVPDIYEHIVYEHGDPTRFDELDVDSLLTDLETLETRQSNHAQLQGSIPSHFSEE